MGMPPRVSVIMPAYNVADYLEAAVRSVIHQTFTDFEIVIVDDGSTDDTAAVASVTCSDEWPERIRIVQPGESGSWCRAQCGAACRARADLFALLDSDDVWEPADS